MITAELLIRFDGVELRGDGKWRARCFAHPDQSPSLPIQRGGQGLLVKCWTGCTLEAITSALGIRVADLFFHRAIRHGQGSRPNPARVNHVALAFTYELGALDRRLRAAGVRQATQDIFIAELADKDLDRLIAAIGRAYGDIARAKLLESVADDLRFKEFAWPEGRCRDDHA